MTASSYYHRGWEAYYGRLNGIRAWCPAKLAISEYLQVDIGTQQTVCAVATQGDGHEPGDWIERYKLEFSLDGANYMTYKENNVDKVGDCTL